MADMHVAVALISELAEVLAGGAEPVSIEITTDFNMVIRFDNESELIFTLADWGPDASWKDIYIVAKVALACGFADVGGKRLSEGRAAEVVKSCSGMGFTGVLFPAPPADWM